MNDKSSPLFDHIKNQLGCNDDEAKEVRSVIIAYYAAGFDGIVLLDALQQFISLDKASHDLSNIFDKLGLAISKMPTQQHKYRKRTQWRKRAHLARQHGKQYKHNVRRMRRATT